MEIGAVVDRRRLSLELKLPEASFVRDHLGRDLLELGDQGAQAQLQLPLLRRSKKAMTTRPSSDRPCFPLETGHLCAIYSFRSHFREPKTFPNTSNSHVFVAPGGISPPRIQILSDPPAGPGRKHPPPATNTGHSTKWHKME